MFVLSCSSRTTFVNFWTLLTFVKFSLTLWVELMAISIFCSVTWQLYNKVSFFHNADCKFWPHKELPGFGGDVHYPDDAAFSNWGAQSDNRPLQTMPTKWHTVQGNTYESSISCRAANFWGHVLCDVSCSVIENIPGLDRWLWTMRTHWKRWWRSLSLMQK